MLEPGKLLLGPLRIGKRKHLSGPDFFGLGARAIARGNLKEMATDADSDKRNSHNLVAIVPYRVCLPPCVQYSTCELTRRLTFRRKPHNGLCAVSHSTCKQVLLI